LVYGLGNSTAVFLATWGVFLRQTKGGEPADFFIEIQTSLHFLEPERKAVRVPMIRRGEKDMKKKLIIALAVTAVLVLAFVIAGSAVSGAAFTTFNAHVDGAGKDVCKNSAIDCNIYGAKEYVWLNGGPTANGLGPDGQYFFAVLVPGGQPNPNDINVGALDDGDKNLSDDYDAYTNRTFTVTDGEVSAYTGTHWLDSGNGGPKPNGEPPLIRLYPYADTTNPGGVYILAICYIGDGSAYPVDPRSCKYDAFKVKKGKVPYQFSLSGIKFQDTYADGVKDPTAIDPGLEGWKICITGTGPDGNPINACTFTDEDGYWSWTSDEYTFTGSTKPGPIHLKVCEDLSLQPGWTQSYPPTLDGCYTLDWTPVLPSYDSIDYLDFGNWQPVSVTACKVRDLDGEEGGETVAVPGWEVSLTKMVGEDDIVLDTQVTGEDGCYTWTDLTPGFSYDVHEASEPGWEVIDGPDKVWPWEDASSGSELSYTFVNAVLEGCTPGFWQGGNDFGTAGGKWLWNEVNDPDWVASGGVGLNPYIWTTPFNTYFTPYGSLVGFDMMDLVGTGGGPDDYQKAARDLVAAYLNSSWGMNYPYSTAELSQMWADAVTSGDFMSLHLTLDAANNSGADTNGDGILEHQCPISASGY
jgi:hypothetical protein